MVGTHAYTDNAMVFNNEYKAESTQVKLSGTKTLLGRETSITDGEFTFELYKTASDFIVNTNVTPITATNNVVSATQGRFEITLNYDDGDEDIYYYVLTEKIPSTKYGVNYDTREYHITVMVADNGKGNIIATVTSVVCDGMSGSFTQSGLDFVNDYNPTPAKHTISGEKSYNLTLSDNMFEFELSDSTGVIETVKNIGNTFTFTELELGYAGVHTYTVREVNGGSTIKGIKYDNSTFTVKITVEDNDVGQLGVTAVEYLDDGAAANKVLFENEYSAAATDAIKIKATKGIEGKTLEENEFSFLLYKADNNGNKKGDAISTAKNKADGTVEFDKELVFDKADTYKYVVVEKKGDNKRVTYDESVYVATIVVKDNGEGKLYIDSTTYQKDGKSANAIEFNNIFTPKPDDIKVEFTAKKTVNNIGSEKIGPENFEFVLDRAEGNQTVKVKSDKDGLAKFALDFTENDIGKTYSYTLYETNDGRENVKYSTQKYEFTIEITLNADNKLVATIIENSKEVKELTPQFVNEYDYTPTPPTPPTPPSETEAPKTGDNFNINLWLALLFVSGGGLFGSFAFGKKAKQK